MPQSHRVDFDDLKARADFRQVLSHYGLTPSGQGDQVRLLCPFHDDERPSCSVNFEKGLWQCFAGCGAGNVLEFVHRMETRDGEVVSLRQAGIKLATICGIALAGAQTRQETRTAPTAKKTALSPSRGKNHAQSRSERQETASEERSEPKRNRPLGFRLSLDPEHPYLSERGIPPELVERFGLGFCAVGSMAGRVCIPIENANGELVAYAGRWTGSEAELPAGEEKYKFPKGFHKSLELFNLHRVKHCRHVVVVEGFFATIRLHGLRFPAVALMGSSLGEEQVSLMLEHCPRLSFVSVMLDGDEPGRKAGDMVAARLAQNWWCRIVHLGEGEEPDTVEPAELERRLGRGVQ
jgi:DNA primase